MTEFAAASCRALQTIGILHASIKLFATVKPYPLSEHESPLTKCQIPKLYDVQHACAGVSLRSRASTSEAGGATVAARIGGALDRTAQGAVSMRDQGASVAHHLIHWADELDIVPGGL